MAPSSSDEKKKTRACTECHKSKSKCVFSLEQERCDRCIRLGKECIPHLSRQGKRKQRFVSLVNDAGALSTPLCQPSGMGKKCNTSCGGTAPRGTATCLGNQARMVNLVETGNLRQLNNSLNLNDDQVESSNNFSQQTHQSNDSNTLQRSHNRPLHAAPQRKMSNTDQATSPDSMMLILSRAVNDSKPGNNCSRGGSNNINSDFKLPQDFLSTVDPAKLKMMISQITDREGSSNSSCITKGNGAMSDRLYQLDVDNLNTSPSPGDMGAQPLATSALLMLAGSSSSNDSVGRKSISTGNKVNSMNNFSAINGTPSSNMKDNTGGSGTFGRSYSAGDNITSCSQSTGLGLMPRRSTMPLEIGTGTSINKNDINQGENTHSNMGGNAESLPKKQKSVHVPNPRQLQSQHASASNGSINGSKPKPPSYEQHPPMPLFLQDSTNINRQDHNDNALGSSSFIPDLMSPEDTIGNYIARACAKHSGQKLTSLKNHYGLQCQIREWISIALIRRSFGLLSKASTLANRCGIHMDRILCGVDDETEGATKVGAGDGDSNSSNLGGRMNYLLSTLLEPRAQQVVPISERYMPIPHLPKEILSIVNCPSLNDSKISNRWIIIRETHRGVTQFFCSPAFERNVLCWTHISQIYEDNLADINSLIFVDDDYRKFLLCNAHQVSLHCLRGMPPKPVRAAKTRIRLLGKQWGQVEYSNPSANKITKEMIQHVKGGNSMTLEMDLRFVSFPTMDKTTYFLEFFHHSRDGSSSVGTSALWTRNPSRDSVKKTAAAAQQSARYLSSEKLLTGSSGRGAPSPGKEAPPAFDDVIRSEDWVGINDVLATGDMDELITALLE